MHTVVVVWLFFKLEIFAVFHVLSKLWWLSSTKFIQGRLDFLFLDGCIFFIFVPSWETLPWQLTSNEVEENVPNSLKIVPSALLFSLVSGHRRIPSCTCKVLSLLIGNVLAVRIFVTFGQAEIDNVNIITILVISTDKEIIRLDVTVNQFLLMYFLDPSDNLDSYQATGLKVKSLLALLEKILQTWSEKIHNHHVKLVFLIRLVSADIVQLWDVSFASQLMNEF